MWKVSYFNVNSVKLLFQQKVPLDTMPKYVKENQSLNQNLKKFSTQLDLIFQVLKVS